MATQQVEFDGDLWFFTAEHSAKSSEVEHEHQVNVAYASAENNRYVSVSGTARLVHDKAKAKELWNPIVKAYFPKGLEDPELALLRVQVDHAEYWDAPGSKVVQMAGFLKGIVTGQPPKLGEHEKVKL
jgi:general stress protein 26